MTNMTTTIPYSPQAQFRYNHCRLELLAAGASDDYELHAACERYAMDRRRTVASVARAYNLPIPSTSE